MAVHKVSLLLIIVTLSSIAMNKQKQFTAPNNFSVVQWNARGISNKFDDLLNTLGFMPDVITIQETLLTKEKILPTQIIENYNITRHGEFVKTKDKQRGIMGKGIMTCIKKCHPSRTHFKQDTIFGTMIISELYIHGLRKIYTVNTYMKHIHQDMNMDEKKVGFKNFVAVPIGGLEEYIMLGDFNCHNQLWGSQYKCAYGEIMGDLALDKNLTIENSGHHTHINKNTGNTCIDLTFSHVKSGMDNYTWEPLDPHGSDHLPILSTWGPNINPKERQIGKIRLNTEKADWEKYYDLWTLVELQEIKDDNIDTYKKNMENKFKEIGIQCMPSTGGEKENTPKPKTSKINFKKTVPWWHIEITIAKIERTLALREWEGDKGNEDKHDLYRRRRNKVTSLIRNYEQAYLESQLQKINADTTHTEVWNIINRMNGNTKPGISNIAPLIDQDGETATTDKEKADTIGKNLEHISSDANYTEKFRKYKKQHRMGNRQLLRKKEIKSNLDMDTFDKYNTPITRKELQNVIARKKNSSPGEDSIQYPFFKHLPSNAINILLDFYNTIWSRGDIPLAFKHAIITPIYKTDKPVSDPSSYRPIALTDHMGKILETVITDRLNSFLEEKEIINRCQSGFQGKRQTHDHLSRIVHAVQQSSDMNRITGACLLDLEKAYDLLWREGCLEEINNCGISGNMYNYILNFLIDRTFQVKINNTLSETFTQQNGVPQGAVISPTLFNILINGVAKLEKKYPHISLAMYADDSAIFIKPEYAPVRKRNSKSFINSAIKKLQYPTNELIELLKSRGFKVNVAKTQCILFRTKNKINNYITLDGVKVNLSDSVKYLGVILDRRLTFVEHIDNILVPKGEKGLHILKYLRGKKWGLKPTLLKQLYQNYVQPKMSYGEELFEEQIVQGQVVGKSAQLRLDKIQNRALETITRCIQGTTTMGMSVLTGIPPLSIKRKEKRANLWCRIVHNPNNPAREIYSKKWETDKRSHRKGKETGITRNTNNILDKMNLQAHMIAPKTNKEDYWNLNTINVDIELSKQINKTEDTPTHSKNITIDYINKHYKHYHKVYTDGSKEGREVGAGIYDETTGSQISYKLNDNLSITSAELIAIKMAIENIPNTNKEEILICTDSLGSCKALTGGVRQGSRPDLILQILKEGKKANEKNKNITVCWIPAHVDIEGNERADVAAKIGKEKENMDIDLKLGYTEGKSLIKKNIKELIWQRLWNDESGQTNKIIQTYLPKTNTQIPLENWRLNRMRMLKPIFGITHKECWCIKCRKPIDIEHVLLECKYFEKERSQIEYALLQSNKTINLINILGHNRDKKLTNKINELLHEIDKRFPI